MKTIIIYTSQTGFTKRYAEWISEACGGECVTLRQASPKKLSEYDAVIFGGWFMAAGITKLAWLKKQLPALTSAGKKVIVYAVGASPAESPDVPVAMQRNFSDAAWASVKAFYCPGGLNYEKMNFPSKFVIQMLVKSLKAKKNASEKEKYQAQMMSHSYDLSNKKYIEPVLKELQA